MDAVRIIPKNAEVLSLGLQVCKPLYDFVRVGDACGIGILGYAPNALYGIIVVDVFFHQIHIRSVFVHRYIDHLDAKRLCNLEMSVISRNRT